MFNIVINHVDIAGQIAVLLNTNNNLKKIHNSYTIFNNGVRYIVELRGNIVIGCVGLLDMGYKDRIVHLSVLQTEQRCGLGYKLIRAAIESSVKKEIYIHIRNDNIRSLNLAYMCGFDVISCIKKLNYYLFNLYITKV